jgi:cytochrome c-type biogenesis protein CcsB
MERTLLLAAALSYFCASALFIAQIRGAGGANGRYAGIGLAIAFAAHTAAIVAHFFQVGLLPVTSFGEGLSFFAWLVVGIFILINADGGISVIGAVISPLAGFLTALSAFVYAAKSTVPPALDSPWLPLHITLAFLGNAVFAVAFAVSTVYLVQEHFLKVRRKGWLIQRLPSLEQLDRLNYRCLAWGFPLLTLGILSGGIWAAYSWGQFWSGEAREILSLITWLVYAGLLQFRLTAGLRGRRAATLTIIGFGLVVVSFFSVNLLDLPGRHGNSLGS